MALSVSLNVKRRNLTKSQTAIAAAQTWILAGARKGDRQKYSDRFSVNEDYVKKARALLDRAPDLADAVKAGTMPLADAYASAPASRRRGGSSSAGC